MSLSSQVQALATRISAEVKSLWTTLDGKVATNDPRLTDARTPTAHGHAIADVTGLQAALDQSGSTAPLLPNFRAAYANRAYGKCVIAGIGDSVMEGEGSTSYEYGWLYRWAFRRARIESRQNTAFVPAWRKATTYAAPWTFSSSSEPSLKIFGIGRRMLIIPNNGTATMSFFGTSVELHFTKDFFQGNPIVTIDGIVYNLPNLNTGASYDDGFVWNSPLLPRGNHTMSVKANAAEVRLSGMKPYDGDESFGVHVYPGGNMGAHTVDWRDSGFGSPTASTGLDTAWPKAYAAINPNLIVIGLVHNDYWLQTPPATTASNYAWMIETLRRVCTSNPSFVLHIPPQRADLPNGGTITYPYQEYIDAITAVAAGDPNIAVLNMADYTQNVASAPASLYADYAHPSSAGHARYADIFEEFLGLGFDKPQTSGLVETHTFSVTGALAAQVGNSRLYLEANYAIDSIRASLGTRAQGGSSAVRVDVNKNGVSVFASQNDRPNLVAGGASTPFTALAGASTTTFAPGDYLTVDVDSVGSNTPGYDLTVTVRLRKL